MTAPTPEQMRALSEVTQNLSHEYPCDAQIVDNVQDALRAAADEVDRLRAVIEDAPHQLDCSSQTHAGICDCWKADAL